MSDNDWIGHNLMVHCLLPEEVKEIQQCNFQRRIFIDDFPDIPSSSVGLQKFTLENATLKVLKS